MILKQKKKFFFCEKKIFLDLTFFFFFSIFWVRQSCVWCPDIVFSPPKWPKTPKNLEKCQVKKKIFSGKKKNFFFLEKKVFFWLDIFIIFDPKFWIFGFFFFFKYVFICRYLTAVFFSGGHPEALQKFSKNLVSRKRSFFAAYSYRAFYPQNTPKIPEIGKNELADMVS